MVSEHANPLATLGGVDAGGQNVHVDALASHLARAGHEVCVFTRRDTLDAPVRVVAPAGYTVEHVPAGPASEVPKDQMWTYMPAFSRHLMRRWIEEPVDVVHAHFWMGGAAALWAAHEVHLPLVQTFHALGTVKQRHQQELDTSPAERIATERMLCRSAEHIIATCQDEVDELTALGLNPRDATIVPCGVDVDGFRAQPHTKKHRKRLLVVGRLVERKGVADVITALSALPDVELVVAGGPPRDTLSLDPEASRLQTLARRLGCADRLTMLGGVAREAMPAIFAAADIVVAAPWYEPFGIVPLEAMACGRPVVGTAVGGLLDTVTPGVTGELVPPRQPQRLAATIAGLLRDPARMERYGIAGIERAHAEYSWRSVAARTERVFEAVIASHAAQSLEVTS